FLHKKGLAHGDIKPQNIIFVNGRPKLADVGLLRNMKADGQDILVGTPGYMPPAPESPGTEQGDVYGLGMVLYVIRTGSIPAHFPELSTTLVENSPLNDFAPFNRIILKACEPDAGKRYQTAAAMNSELVELAKLRDSKPEAE